MESMDTFRILLVLVVALILTCTVLPSIVSAFNYSEYLFDNETVDDITTENFTLDSISYTLVYVNDKEAMIIRGNTLIDDPDDINDVINRYFQKQYWPTDEELTALKEYIENFNASRNGPSKLGPAEDYCLSATFMYPERCHSEDECMMAASTYCGIVGSVGLSCSPLYVQPMFYHYSTTLDAMDEHTSEAVEKVEELENNKGDLENTLNEIESFVNALEDDADSLLTSDLFDEGKCTECLGICFALPINYTYIDDAKELINELQAKVQPLGDIDAVSNQIYLETVTRINFEENKKKAPVYRERYNSIISSYDSSLTQTEEVLKYVINGDLAAYYNDIIELKEKLSRQLETYSFTNTTDAEISLLESKFKAMDALLAQNLTARYETAKESMDDATSKIIQARWYIDATNSIMVDKLNALGELYNEYVSEFQPPMTNNDYDGIKAKFDALSEELDKVLKSSPKGEGTVAAAIADLSRRSADFVFSMAGAVISLDEETKQRWTPMVPPLLLLIGDFTLIAFAIIIFVLIAHSKRDLFAKKMVLLSWTVLLLLFIGVVAVGSIAIYNIMKSTIEEGNFHDFIDGLRSSDSVAILIDERGADSATIANMENCKEKVVNKLYGKDVISYSIVGDYCTVNRESRSIDDCLAEIRNFPSIIMEYSPDSEDYAFKSLYIYEVRMTGSSQFYSKCELAYAINLE